MEIYVVWRMSGPSMPVVSRHCPSMVNCRPVWWPGLSRLHLFNCNNSAPGERLVYSHSRSWLSCPSLNTWGFSFSNISLCISWARFNLRHVQPSARLWFPQGISLLNINFILKSQDTFPHRIRCPQILAFLQRLCHLIISRWT